MRQQQSLTDGQLAALLQNGDKAAFTEIYQRYWQNLLSIAYNHSRDKSSAEEIVQEVFISLWDNREKVNINSLPAYLATAVKFSIFKLIQRHRRHREIEARHFTTILYTSEESLIDARFLQDYINGVVEQLPEKCGLVFKYSRFHGMTIPEISKQMNISPKTVESHLTKALKVLRSKLRDADVLLLLLSSGILR